VITGLRFWRRSIGARIIILFLGLLLVVQLASFAALRARFAEHARQALPTRLVEGERLLQHLLDRNAQRVTDGGRLLAADYGFREALASNDDETIVSVLANHVACFLRSLGMRFSRGCGQKGACTLPPSSSCSAALAPGDSGRAFARTVQQAVYW